MAMERLENMSDEVTEGWSSVRVDEERVQGDKRLHGRWVEVQPSGIIFIQPYYTNPQS